MKAYILIDIRTGEIHDVIRQIRRVEGVLEATITFGPYDAIAVVETDSVKTIGKIMTKAIQPIPGVIETLTCLAVED